VRRGYDNTQLRAVRDCCAVPLIASGGAGEMQHFKDTFTTANVDGALAASVFHNAEINIGELKQFLADQKISIRI
jgi:cyclase